MGICYAKAFGNDFCVALCSQGFRVDLLYSSLHADPRVVLGHGSLVEKRTMTGYILSFVDVEDKPTDN